MGREEQKEEREVLDSIFPDEITDVSETSYRVSVALDVKQQDEDEAEPPPLILSVTYPENYPDGPPSLDLYAPPNSAKYAYLDIQADRTQLLSSLEPTIEENIGMAMIFTLVSTLKDSAELLIFERQTAAQALKDVEASKVEEEENRKFHGTAVTRESFLKWRAEFRKEIEHEEIRRMEEKEAEDKKKKVKVEERMTGKQLWEKGLVGKMDEDEDEDEIGKSPEIGEDIMNLKVEESKQSRISIDMNNWSRYEAVFWPRKAKPMSQWDKYYGFPRRIKPTISKDKPHESQKESGGSKDFKSTDKRKRHEISAKKTVMYTSSDLSEIITIKAGDDHDLSSFAVHENLLCSSSLFFQAIRRGDWKESHERVISFPENESHLMEVYVRWLYASGDLDKAISKVPYELENELWRLIDLYLLGQQLQDVRFRNSAVERVAKHLEEEPSLDGGIISKVFSETAESAPIRRLFVHYCVQMLRSDLVELVTKDEDDLPKCFLAEITKLLAYRLYSPMPKAEERRLRQRFMDRDSRSQYREKV